MSAPSRVQLRQRRRESAWLRAAIVLAVVTVALGGYLFARITNLTNNQNTLAGRLDSVTVLAGQNQVAAGTNSIGPPAKSVASGKAKPPPQEIAPTSPTSTPSYRPIAAPTLTPAQETHVAGMVLARVKVPQPTAADLSRAVVAVLKAHPSLTLAQVTAAVSAYERKHPPAPGSPGASGASGLPGSAGPLGPMGVGISGIAATEDTSTNPPTVTFHFALSDGTSTDVGPLDLPVGPIGPSGSPGADGKDAPTITSHRVTNEGDGNCVDTLYLSDGSSHDSDPYACSPPPTESPSPSLVP